jgi:hypothetical protein
MLRIDLYYLLCSSVEDLLYFFLCTLFLVVLSHRNFLEQLIGTPNEVDLDFVNENARRYIRQLPCHPRQSFPEKFPHVQPLAIDLVEKMLTFDPRLRITGKLWLFLALDICISFLLPV